MKLKVNVKVNMKTAQAMAKVVSAAEAGLRDTTIEIARDVVNFSPYLTGNNRRSIDFILKGMSSRIFSTSGYGGYLETGTSRMPARPYFRKALDLHYWRYSTNIRRWLRAAGG